jgi:hypothetical protein
MSVQGLYEIVINVKNLEKSLPDFIQAGYQPIMEGELEASVALLLYGIDSNLTALRLQKTVTQTHGLIRLWEWNKRLQSGLAIVTFRVSPLENYRERLILAGATSVTEIFSNEFGEPALTFKDPFRIFWGFLS